MPTVPVSPSRNSISSSLKSIFIKSLKNKYSIYVEHFAGFAKLYGSVYAVALAMLWLYCCMSIVFYGGGLNRYLAERKRKKM